MNNNNTEFSEPCSILLVPRSPFPLDLIAKEDGAHPLLGKNINFKNLVEECP